MPYSKRYFKKRFVKGNAKLFFIFLVTVIVLIISILTFQLSKNKGSPISLDLQIQNRDNSFLRNESLVFNVGISSKKNYDIDLRYEIMKFGENEIVFNKEFRTKVRKNRLNTFEENINLKEFSPGTYRLGAIVALKKLERSDYSSFIIKDFSSSLPETKKEIISQNRTFDNEKSIIESQEKESQPKKLSLQEIVELGIINEKKAEGLCISINNKNESEECLTLLALKTKNSDICLKIGNIITKDGCFVNLAIGGNYDLCEKIQDQYQRLACMSLRFNQEE